MTAAARVRLPATSRTFLYSGLATIAFPLSAFATAPILARGLGPDGRGELAALLTPLAVAEAVAALGTPLAAAYFIRSGTRFRSVRSAGLWIVTLAGLATTLALVAAAPLLLGTYPELVPTFRWLAVGVFVGAYIEFYRGVRSGQEAYGRVNANYWLGAMGRLAGIVVLALLGALTPERVAVLSIAVGLIAGLTLLHGRGPATAEPPTAPGVTRRAMWRFSLQTWAGVVSGSIGSRLDQLLLIGLVTPEVLGVYVVAGTAASVPMAFFPAIQRLFLNRAAGRSDAAVITKASRLSATVALGTVLCLEPFMPLLVSVVFGPAFDDAGPLAQVLLVGAGFWGIGQGLSGLLIGVGKPAAASTADAVGVVVMAGSLLGLHAWFGVMGAAVAVVLGSAVPALWKAALLARHLGIPAVSLLVPAPRMLWRAVVPVREGGDRDA